jgi:hypothetical protein
MEPKDITKWHYLEPTPLWTRSDLQRWLGVSERTLSRLLATGQLPAPLFVGCRGRWRPADVETFLASKS